MHSELQKIFDVVAGKKVVHILSVPPEDMQLKDYDVVSRCNCHWATDETRCDINFFCGAEDKIRVSWLFEQMSFREQCKLFCCFQGGAAYPKVKKICQVSDFPLMLYGDEHSYLRNIMKWFQFRGTRPSTGRKSAYMLAQCEPKELLITGGDLYASDPEHVGWQRHNPMGHVEWYARMANDYPFIKLGKDLINGMKYWSEQEYAEENKDS